jgi:hypothetical protein
MGTEQWCGEVNERLRFGRASGYSGLDIVLLLFFYFNSGLRVGIKEFCRRTVKVSYRLAAMARRRKLPTQASMSRGLARVDVSEVRAFADWLFLEGSGGQEVLRHEACFTRDSLGLNWSFFDFDPTVTAIRQRKLPKGENLPEAQRRASQAKAGYSGRKRGDVQFKRSTLQHAGSGLWLLAEYHAGNEGTFESWKRALHRIEETCLFAGLEQDRAVIRGDGECGSVPFIHECIEAHVHYVTRSSAYHILNDPAVARHLAEASWEKVQSSGSGPCRFATELGEVTLTASRETSQAHGVNYPSVSTRMVVSRFKSKSKRGTGVAIDGWQYELYPTDLPLEPWPAADVVWAYYGRIGEENRFGQEDREFELDRIYSYNLAGQELAATIGLFVWNQQLCRGFDLAPPENAVHAQTLRESEFVTLAPLPAASGDLLRDEQASSNPSQDVGASSVDEAEQELMKSLGKVDLGATVERLGAHWSQHPNGLSLVCPNNVELPIICVENSPQRCKVHFKVRSNVCRQCPDLDKCSRSVTPNFRKKVSCPLPSSEVATEIHNGLSKFKSVKCQQVREEQRVVHFPPPQTKLPTTPLAWLPRQTSCEQVFAPSSPMLLPANLRKRFTRACEDAEVEIATSLWARRKRLGQLRAVATSEADRQHRRQSHESRDRWNSLPDHAVAQITIEVPASLAAILEKEEVCTMKPAA